MGVTEIEGTSGHRAFPRMQLSTKCEACDVQGLGACVCVDRSIGIHLLGFCDRLGTWVCADSRAGEIFRPVASKSLQPLT